MIKGFRHVPQYDDMFKDMFEKTPARAPDRTALQLYESPAYAFIGRPFAQMNAFHMRNLMGAQREMGMQMTAMREGKPHVELMAQSGSGPPPPPPGGPVMDPPGAIAQVVEVSELPTGGGMPPGPPAPPAPSPPPPTTPNFAPVALGVAVLSRTGESADASPKDGVAALSSSFRKGVCAAAEGVCGSGSSCCGCWRR